MVDLPFYCCKPLDCLKCFKGSEENTIVYVVGNSGLQNWQHVYTAVTRGRSRVYIVANEEQLQAAIDRKRSFRKTYLQKRLRDAEKMVDSEPTSSQRSENLAFCSGNSSMDTDKLVVSDEMKNGNALGRTVELAGTPEETSRKRQCRLPEECPSPSKMALVRVPTSFLL